MKKKKKTTKSDIALIKERARKLNKKPVAKVKLSKYPLDKSKRESYSSKYNICMVPESSMDLQKLANEMLLWVYENEEALAIEDFPLSKRIAPSIYYKQANRDEYFKQALEITRYVIGSRLQKLAREDKIDPRYALKMLPLYNPEYKDFLMGKIESFQKSIGGATDRVRVVMEKFASSNLVPEKIK